MPALIDLRRRIRSVHNTQQITQAMKTVSTAKFKKAQRAILEARPYFHGLPELVREIAQRVEAVRHPLLLRREEIRIQGIVITSDKGLCGAFNSNLLENAFNFFEEKARNSEIKLMLMGKKAVSFFKKHRFPFELVSEKKVEKLTLEDMDALAQRIREDYLMERVDGVYIVYNEFKSILSPQVTITKVLPLEGGEKEVAEREEGFVLNWEPEPDKVLNDLLPLYLCYMVRHAVFESLAAEHAARMMAMDNATQNAEELISDMILVLNKIRQASITKELLEIMTAVEALSK